jgi:hypothetical protein
MSEQPPQQNFPPMRTSSTSVSGWRRALRGLAFVAALLIVTEGVSFVVLRLLALRDRAKPTADEAAPAYRDQPWAAAYWREHKRYLAQSYENYPYGLWRLRPFSGETINVGPDGLRRTANVKCGGAEPIIYVFGSSAVWGQGSPDWGSIPSLLAKRFADDARAVCVINHGADAWRSSESVIQLIEELRRPGARAPAAVIFIDSCNDVLTPFVYTGRVDLPYNFKKDWLDVLALIHQGSFYYLTATNSWTLAGRLIHRAAGSQPFPAVEDPGLLGRQIVDTYLNNVRIVDGLSGSYGFRYDFFWLPLNVDGMAPIYRVAVENTAPLIHAHVSDHVHDLTGTYGADLTLDVCHLVPAGNKIVADKIYETIRQDVKPPG